jgi:hypothetical protein
VRRERRERLHEREGAREGSLYVRGARGRERREGERGEREGARGGMRGRERGSEGREGQDKDDKDSWKEMTRTSEAPITAATPATTLAIARAPTSTTQRSVFITAPPVTRRTIVVRNFKMKAISIGLHHRIISLPAQTALAL